MIELLKLCGFREDEIDSELPRVEGAFRKLGITTEDIERGKQRLTRYYDIELEGLRRVFRLCLRELVSALLVRDTFTTLRSLLSLTRLSRPALTIRSTSILMLFVLRSNHPATSVILIAEP